MPTSRAMRWASRTISKTAAPTALRLAAEARAQPVQVALLCLDDRRDLRVGGLQLCQSGVLAGIELGDRGRIKFGERLGRAGALALQRAQQLLSGNPALAAIPGGGGC